MVTFICAGEAIFVRFDWKNRNPQNSTISIISKSRMSPKHRKLSLQRKRLRQLWRLHKTYYMSAKAQEPLFCKNLACGQEDVICQQLQWRTLMSNENCLQQSAIPLKAHYMSNKSEERFFADRNACSSCEDLTKLSYIRKLVRTLCMPKQMCLRQLGRHRRTYCPSCLIWNHQKRYWQPRIGMAGPPFPNHSICQHDHPAGAKEVVGRGADQIEYLIWDQFSNSLGDQIRLKSRWQSCRSDYRWD